MPWSLVSGEGEGEGQQRYAASVGDILYLLQGKAGLTAAHSAPQDESLIVGTLAVLSHTAKLEVSGHAVKITPFHRNEGDDGPPLEDFVLQARANGRVESISLRNKDTISSASGPGSLTFTWQPPQVQVNSSMYADKEVLDSRNSPPSMDAAEDETEDDEDLNNAILPGVSKSQNLRLTPLPSEQRTEIVQETPNIDRNVDVSELVSRSGPPRLDTGTSMVSAVVYSTAPQESTPVPRGEIIPESPDGTSSKRAHSPEVQISTMEKRPSPDAQDEPSSLPGRAPKRRKVENTPASGKESTRKPASKGRKRAADEKPGSTPPKSQHSSQYSVVATRASHEGVYEGPKPRVATSNSSIKPGTALEKFLKSQGGAFVDSVSDSCNVLCIRTGQLSRTLKLLQSIAAGIPIVTDKWLIDSAAAGHLLPLASYIPPDLTSIWTTPQSDLLENYTIYFTPALKSAYGSDFTGIDKLCKAIGARRIVSRKLNAKDKVDPQTAIFLAMNEEDAKPWIEEGHVCHSKDFLSTSIVRGGVDLQSEEFRIGMKSPKKKGRPRKTL